VVHLFHDLELDAAIIRKLDNCGLIVRAGAGFDNIDIVAARERGIPVCYVPDYGTEDVADHALALTLSLVRGIYTYSETVRENEANWDCKCAGPLFRLRGAKFGIIGLGRIGIATAVRAKAFGFDIHYYDPYREDGFDKAIGGLARHHDLTGLLKEADIVSLHTPMTPETHGMVDRNFIKSMKQGSYLVNTARGKLVDLDALHEGLHEGRIAGAGLDVLPVEPAADAHPLIHAWRTREDWLRHRLIITPHSGFYSGASAREMREKAALRGRDFLEGKPLRNVVNP
jgi:lactate dehydrogenase-like 2-hydroxyacid dehydrogenase